MDGHHRRRHERLLRDLEVTIPTPFDPWEFCRHVAERRARPIHILRMDTTEAASCGLWLATQKADYVVVDEGAPAVLAGHIILHELAHMLLGHTGQIKLDAAALGFEVLDPTMVQRVLGRTSRYLTEEERDAEGFASVIKSFAARWSPVPRPRDGDAEHAAVIDRFSSALAGDRRWRR
ncbi:hypothetical protein DFJ67_0541 [Asanoa ferruginea]|uniref:Uncharacterized protein n=2 Tax=Asanoa ferruginea TaxID=53367 RepID=A0A3D9ZDS3_9ACTN|nr:hypothetical protein DFJ67_0541 [Asanoa ferruginea]